MAMGIGLRLDAVETRSDTGCPRLGRRSSRPTASPAAPRSTGRSEGRSTRMTTGMVVPAGCHDAAPGRPRSRCPGARTACRACPKSAISIRLRKSRRRSWAAAFRSCPQPKRLPGELADATAPIVIPGPRANDDWSQPGGEPTNAPGHLALSAGVRQTWSASAGTGSNKAGRIIASPIVYGGSIHARCRGQRYRLLPPPAVQPSGAVARADAGEDGERWVVVYDRQSFLAWRL